jgi:predicted permease
VDAVLERIRSLPGVEAAGATDIIPILTGGGSNGNVRVPGRDEPVFSYFREASDGYFKAMGIPLLKGRVFEASDTKPPVSTIVVSASFARDYFAGEDPIGKTIDIGGSIQASIVGVVGDANMDDVEQSTDMQTLYLPGRPVRPECDLVVRVQGRPETYVPMVRQILRSQWRDVPLDQMDTFRSRLARLSRNTTTQTSLLGLLAGLALLLAAAGVYGVLSRDVAERRREIGIRMALGGTMQRVTLEILRYGALLVGVGLGLGAIGVLALGRIMASLLYRVSPTDPISILLAALLLAVAALLATLIPALHAARVDPAVALRNE